MSTGDIETLYKNRPASLWVEDTLARDYLLTVWNGAPQVSILIAGGVESVRGLTSKARHGGHSCVFGLSDRDFGTTNRSKWTSKMDVFRLEMHEIENALLHDCGAIENALATLGRSRLEKAIRNKLESTAKRFVWGMALGATLRWLHESSNSAFPDSSGLINVSTKALAEDRISKCDWWTKTLPSLNTTISLAAVQKKLHTLHSTYDADIQSDSFLKSFAGKEILGHVESWMLQGGRPEPKLTSHDLIKAIAEQQRLSNTVPAEIREVETHILGAI